MTSQAKAGKLGGNGGRGGRERRLITRLAHGGTASGVVPPREKREQTPGEETRITTPGERTKNPQPNRTPPKPEIRPAISANRKKEPVLLLDLSTSMDSPASNEDEAEFQRLYPDSDRPGRDHLPEVRPRDRH